jgi:m7GpppX diphosphatase
MPTAEEEEEPRSVDSEDQIFRSFEFERLLDEGDSLLPIRLTADPFHKFASLLGRINDKPAILTLQKTAFGNDLPSTTDEAEYPSLKLIERNDIYRWYLASISAEKYSVKATIIYPATDVHIRKHEKQRRRMVRETPEMYKEHIEKYVQTMKGSRIQW